MKKGRDMTTQDINQKFLMGELNGDEVWILEGESKIGDKDEEM